VFGLWLVLCLWLLITHSWQSDAINYLITYCQIADLTLTSDVVLETRVLVSRCLQDKKESLGLEHLVLVLVLKKKSCSFSRLLL